MCVWLLHICARRWPGTTPTHRPQDTRQEIPKFPPYQTREWGLGQMQSIETKQTSKNRSQGKLPRGGKDIRSVHTHTRARLLYYSCVVHPVPCVDWFGGRRADGAGMGSKVTNATNNVHLSQQSTRHNGIGFCCFVEIPSSEWLHSRMTLHTQTHIGVPAELPALERKQGSLSRLRLPSKQPYRFCR